LRQALQTDRLGFGVGGGCGVGAVRACTGHLPVTRRLLNAVRDQVGSPGWLLDRGAGLGASSEVASSDRSFDRSDSLLLN